MPILLRALNEHIANERHAITVLKLKSGEFGGKSRMNGKYEKKDKTNQLPAMAIR